MNRVRGLEAVTETKNGECKMRKRVKKPLALLMALLMMLTMFGSQVFAESTAPADAAAAVQGEEGTAGNDDDAGNAEIDSTAGTAAQDAGDGSQDADTKSAETAGTVEYVPEEQPNGVTVKAYAAEGVLPDGAVMKVTMLDAEGDTADQYNEAAAALEESDVDYAGFLAMDISFYDAEGNEIEPEDGAVNVQFEVDESLLPEEAEADTLAVQHLAETEDGIQVETVADAADVTDGTVAVEGKAVTAEFSVESFSYFTITWGSDWSWSDYFQITVHYVNTNGNELTVDSGQTVQNINISGVSDGRSKAYKFADYERTISGYNYIGAKYSQNENFSNAQDVIRMVASQNTTSSGGWWGSGSKTTRYLKFYNSESGAQNLIATLQEDDRWAQSAHIYLVYESNGSGGGTGGGGETITNASVTTGKTAVLKDDESGNYDLTLSISGDRGQADGEDVKVDILFILDESGSMDYSLYSDNDAGWGDSRMDLLKEAVRGLITTVESNDDIDARYSAVSFSRSQYRDQVGWTSANGVRTFINDLDPNGGTNYQQGINDGKQLLNSKRTGALTFVIFVSDGEPTYRGVDVTNYTGDNENGNGQNDNEGKNIAAAVEEIGSMSSDYFYAIGMGPEFGQDKDWWGNVTDKQGTVNLKSLANAVNAKYKGDSNVYSANDTAGLEKAFSDIASSISFFAAEDVTVTDQLSNYADIVLNADNAAEFTITVSRDARDESSANTWTTETPVTSEGNLTFQNRDGENVIATVKYDSSKKIITLDFPDDYELEEGYIYSVSTVITPSEAAVNAGMGSDAAGQTPDSGTGTHAEKGEQGFWSNVNENAKVTFTANGEDGEEFFPKPVIQVQKVPTGSLTVTKVFAGIDAEDSDVIGTSEFTFTIEKLKENNEGNLVVDTDFTDTELGFTDGVKTITITGAASQTISGLPTGQYRVTETAESIPESIGDYVYVSNSISPENPVTVEKDQTAAVTVTNTYNHRDKTLTITKKVDGNMGDRTHDFDFELTVLQENGELLTADDYRQIAGTAEKNEAPLSDLEFDENGKAAFTLRNNQTFTIAIPHGCQYTVEEVNNDGYKVGIKVTAGDGDVDNGKLTGTLTENISATFTNDRTVNPPTGLIHTSAPFAAMIIIALGAVVIFITGRRIRR